MKDRRDLYCQAGVCLEVDGLIKQSVSCFEECHDWAEEFLPEDDPYRLTVGLNLVHAFLANRKAKKAIDLLQDTVKIPENTLGKIHTNLLKSQHELGRDYLDLDCGYIGRSIELLEHFLDSLEKSLVQDMEAFCSSHHELGRHYLAATH